MKEELIREGLAWVFTRYILVLRVISVQMVWKGLR
jgi:hypothetical protein